MISLRLPRDPDPERGSREDAQPCLEHPADFFFELGAAGRRVRLHGERSGFLHHMVRNLVGTFILVGKGTLRPEDVTRILEARNRSAAGATAPASGLYLVNVEY